jgi:hypothetical protein
MKRETCGETRGKGLNTKNSNEKKSGQRKKTNTKDKSEIEKRDPIS